MAEKDKFNPLDNLEDLGLPDSWLIYINQFEQVDRPWWEREAELSQKVFEELEKE